MDIPLSSDALDLALHPDPATNILAVGLISGKVQAIDLSDFVNSQNNGKGKAKGVAASGGSGGKRRKVETPAEVDSDDEGAAHVQSRQYEKKWSRRFSKKSCRGVEFDHDGSRLWCLSKDKSIYALDPSTSQVTTHWASAHTAAPSRLLPLPNHSNLVVTGDDDGIVNLWDDRISPTSKTADQHTATPVRSYDHHFDWITDFHYSSHLAPPRLTPEQRQRKKKEAARLKDKKRAQRKQARDGSDSDDDSDDSGSDSDSPNQPPTLGRERLVCTSGDGSLSVIDFRQGSHRKSTTTQSGSSSKPPSSSNDGVEQSEDQEDELLSITSVRSGSKLVVGTQLGILSLWAPSRGLLDHIDRIPGHPQSIDALLPLDESTILTGSSDGLVRVVQILPHKFLGVVVDHGMGLPVERMKRKEGLLVSCGHGGEVKCTDIGSLLEDDDEEDSDDEEDDDDADAETLARRVSAQDVAEESAEEDVDEDEEIPNDQQVQDSDEEADDDDDDDEDQAGDSDSDSDEETPPPPPPKPLTKKELKRQKTLSAGGQTKDTHETQDFFADL